MKKIIITFLVPFVSISSLYSQNKTITGRVITEDLEIMPYTQIVINDTVKVGKTDLNGYFKIDIPVSVKKILLRDVGMETTTITLEDSCNEVEIIVMFDIIYDFITLRRVDRLRMKRLKKIPELHRQAFEKGIFKTPIACYTQEIIPYYEKKKK